MSPAPTSMKASIAPYAAYMVLLPLALLLPPSERFWLYPAQTILCGALLIKFWAVYRLQAPKMTGFTVITAILMLIFWISPQLVFGPGLAAAQARGLFLWISPQKVSWLSWRLEGFDPTVFKATPALYFTIVAVRFIRLAVIVPFVEEIFWRGFLLRYLVNEDFESVPPGTFTWLSFCLVTAAFCMEHQYADYPGALVAGLLFNFIYYRTRSLSSCILAHAVANFLLGIYIMRTGQWGFW